MQLAQELGETVKLSIWNEESQDVESLCTAVGNSKMHIQVPIGIHFPKHAGAASKILLALNEKNFREVQKWQEPLLAYTPNTITDIPTLQSKLEQVRQEGWAYDEQEYQEGIEALACAVFAGSSPLAALSVPYIANSAIRERIYAQKERIWQCARQIASDYQALL